MSDDVSSIDEPQLLGRSDWEDEDLLSIDEASDRLEAEISTLRASLAEQPDGPQRAAATTRLDALMRALESIRQGPTPLARARRES